MSRRKGVVSISTNYEVKIKAPFDARQLCETKEDLINADSWSWVSTYVGMLVSVASDPVAENNGVYFLKVDEPTVESSWVKLFDNIEFETFQEKLAQDLANYVTQEQLSGYAKIHFGERPEIGDENTIYFNEVDGNIEEWIWYNNDYVIVGSSTAGLDNYYTKAEVDGLIAELDVAEVAVNANETVSTISEADGKIAVAKQAIQITTSQVTGLDTALAGKADTSAVTAVEGNVTALQNSVANIEANVGAIQGAGYQTAAQVNALIANATIEPGKINGAVANAQYATQAGVLINSITLNVAGTEHQFNGGEAVSVDITAAGLGALTSVPVATNEALGGIKVGFTTAGTNYAVQLDANNAAYVTVPVPEVPEYTAGDGILVSDHVVSIADNGVTTAKIADNAVTDAKIVSINTDKITQGAEELVLNGGTAN